jgi:hypothetical protein
VKDSEQYRQHEADCMRLAKSAAPKDKEILLKMAAAWKLRAEAAEHKPKGKD